MLAELAAGFGSLKSALELAKSLNGASNQAAINDAKIGLQSHILDAQQALFSAQQAQAAQAERISALERELAALKRWNLDIEKYELTSVDSGAFVYAMKTGLGQGEPPHWLCAACFRKGSASILQSKGNEDPKTGRRLSHSIWTCSACRGEISVHYARRPSDGTDKSGDS